MAIIMLNNNRVKRPSAMLDEAEPRWAVSGGDAVVSTVAAGNNVDAGVR